MKIKGIDTILKTYSECLSKLDDCLYPECQIRSSFIHRLDKSYNGMFESMKTLLDTEFTKYENRISALLKKNKQYENLFNEIRKKEENLNKYANIFEMNNKLDSVESEISISKIFQNRKVEESEQKSKHSDSALDDADQTSKDTVTQLQEILAAMYNMTGPSSNIFSLAPIEKSNFKMDEFQKEFMSKMKGAQFSAAKSLFEIMTNKSKFREMSIQTETDAVSIELEELKLLHEKLQRKFDSQLESLNHVTHKFNSMKVAHDEERRRWIYKESEITQIQNQTQEIERKYKQAKSEESSYKYKIKELAVENTQKEVRIVELQDTIVKQQTYYESSDYIIKQIENSINDVRSSGYKNTNKLYESFMKMNLGGDVVEQGILVSLISLEKSIFDAKPYKKKPDQQIDTKTNKVDAKFKNNADDSQSEDFENGSKTTRIKNNAGNDIGYGNFYNYNHH